MINKKVLTYMVIGAAVLLLAVSVGTVAAKGPTLTPQEQLGKALFFDTNLSQPRGEACAACHGPDVGYTGPDPRINAAGAVYEGAVHGRFGNRKPPTAAYAGASPELHYDGTTWVGGMFWDGRATGATLGDPLAEQAQGPFLNPLEQANPDAKAVVAKALASSYRHLFTQVCGSRKTTDQYYDCIGRSIAAYERSKEVSSFTSKYDLWLKGKAKLTSQERLGLALFEGKAKCSGCHISQPGPNGEPPLFTDYTYDNLGVPKNPKNPFYKELDVNPLGANWVDLGLGVTVNSDAENGKFKVPTLRDVDKRPYPQFVKAYAHNGYFKSLAEIVHFYNTRDVLPTCDANSLRLAGLKCWPAPEYSTTVNHSELGNLGLTRGEEAALVAFLKTLSDGYQP
jgi:cytochrome c peroxidase